MTHPFQSAEADRFLLLPDSNSPHPTPEEFPNPNPKSKIQNPKSEPFPGLPDLPPTKGDRELLYVLVIGSEAGVLETLYELQRRGFANVTDWSCNLPSPREMPQPRSGDVMRILQRYRLRGCGLDLRVF